MDSLVVELGWVIPHSERTARVVVESASRWRVRSVAGDEDDVVVSEEISAYNQGVYPRLQSPSEISSGVRW